MALKERTFRQSVSSYVRIVPEEPTGHRSHAEYARNASSKTMDSNDTTTNPATTVGESSPDRQDRGPLPATSVSPFPIRHVRVKRTRRTNRATIGDHDSSRSDATSTRLGKQQHKQQRQLVAGKKPRTARLTSSIVVTFTVKDVISSLASPLSQQPVRDKSPIDRSNRPMNIPGDSSKTPIQILNEANTLEKALECRTTDQPVPSSDQGDTTVQDPKAIVSTAAPMDDSSNPRIIGEILSIHNEEESSVAVTPNADVSSVPAPTKTDTTLEECIAPTGIEETMVASDMEVQAQDTAAADSINIDLDVDQTPPSLSTEHPDKRQNMESSTHEMIANNVITANATNVDNKSSASEGFMPVHQTTASSASIGKDGNSQHAENSINPASASVASESSANDSTTIEKHGATSNTEISKPKVGTVKLQPGLYAVSEFDIFSQDWDELVRQAAEGLIPDGKICNPVAEVEKVTNNKKGIFSPDLIDLLAPTPKENILRSPQVSNDGDESRQSSEFFFQPMNHSLPQHVYPDDFSVPSSLGTNREDFPTMNKFQLAEENSEYDGPDSCRGMAVLKNLDLYFSTFVFPLSVPQVPQSLYEELTDDDNWQTVALRYPRIQLWPEDRRWLEAFSNTGDTSQQIADLVANRERFIRVWEEEIIPCGKPSLRRLLPNRLTRLGFHGDELFTAGGPDPYSACRKVILCLSSSAFYVIVSDDNVTEKAKEKKKKFPIPIPKDSFFRDAPWPHAVARHSFKELHGITIGFGFQRLTLRFSNPSIRTKADPFTYVLLTANKIETVSLLQEIQVLVKESSEDKSDMLSATDDDAGIPIDNDDRNVLDALNAVVAPDVLGVVLHYQVVLQRWKHGERGMVRRACVVTDTKLFLLDEDYVGDGSGPFEPSIGTRQLGDVRYHMVDEASLKQVAEVQAADADPKAITIVIHPLSRLSRTHRWRLVCRDSSGAERLVEDVRKAMTLMTE